MSTYLITIRKTDKDKFGNFRKREVNRFVEFERDKPTRTEIEKLISKYGVILFMQHLSDW